MPWGASPGERRGGRQKGTQNKATAARAANLQEFLATAFVILGPEAIDRLTPAQLQLIAMREAAKGGFITAALSIAKDAAPYFDSKLAPLIVEPPKEPEEERARRLHDALKGMRETVGEPGIAETPGTDAHDAAPEGRSESAL